MSIAVKIESDSVVVERDGVAQVVEIQPSDSDLVTMKWFREVYCRGLISMKTLSRRCADLGIDPSCYEKLGHYQRLPFGMAKKLIEK